VRLQVPRPEIVQLFVGVVNSGLSTSSAWRRDVSVYADEIEERRNRKRGEVQCKEVTFERRIRTAFIRSSGRLR
jgi:hypothetical protein